MRSAGLNKDGIAQLLGFNWITQHLNVLTKGPIGAGKTFKYVLNDILQAQHFVIRASIAIPWLTSVG
jgi:hypothetical protein